MEEWLEIDEFPGYSVSDAGRVRNDSSGLILSMAPNQQGIIKVGLMRDGKQHQRSVSLLVANAFLPPSTNPRFDTPINLDGDRENNFAENLAWRPRWFAVKYHKQFYADGHKGFIVPIEDIETGERFENGMEAVVKYGLLDHDILTATVNRTFVFPTGQRFRVIEEE